MMLSSVGAGSPGYLLGIDKSYKPAPPIPFRCSLKYSGFQIDKVHHRNRVSAGFLARNRFSLRNPVSLYFTYLESAVLLHSQRSLYS